MFLAFLLQFVLLQQRMPVGPVAETIEPSLAPAVVGWCDELGTVRSDDIVRFQINSETAYERNMIAWEEYESLRLIAWNQAGFEREYLSVVAAQQERLQAWDRLYKAISATGLYYRLICLRELRDIIGPANYYAGVMPLPMIVWDCSKK
jgi:hypothetical protein